MLVPRIETERLVLREMRRRDFDAYVALWQEPEVVRFIGGAPQPRSESWGRFLKLAGNWMIEGFGQWAITLRASGALIGQTGFFTGARDIGADFDSAPEAGWVLSGKFHGKGLGREAVVAVHRWFDAQEFGGRSHAMISVGHDVSLKLACSLGYQTMREMEISEGDVVALLRRDLRADPDRPDGALQPREIG